MYEEIARKQAGCSETKILVEPVGRNTAACIGLAALHIRRQDENAPIIVLPADHYIANIEKFVSFLSSVAKIARTGVIVTLGIMPTRPETGYGYIKAGEEKCYSNEQPYFCVDGFVEKPNHETALKYLSNGSYVWNSGIFVFTAKTILSELESCIPNLYQQLKEIDNAIGSPNYEAVVENIYPNIESISIDYGVLEKTKIPIYVLKTDFGWSDVGSWQSLYELQSESHDQEGNLSVGDVVTIDSKNNFLYSTTGRTISLLGVNGLIVVDTDDTVLITKMERSQDVKKVIENLKKTGRAHLC